MEIYSHEFIGAHILICAFSYYSHVVYHVLLYSLCHVCFAMYDITDFVFRISNKDYT